MSGVRLGLPALTAPELTTLNRAAEDAYQSTHSMDQALLALVQGFDKAYNTRRAQIKGEIVARVSAFFGFDLPVIFPYYQGGNAGQPVQNRLSTQSSRRHGSDRIEG